MKAFSPLRVGLLLLGTVGVVLYFICRAWPGSNLDLRSIAISSQEMAEAEQRFEELQAERESVLTLIDRKTAIVEALIDGRVSLLEAAARVRSFYAARPEHLWDYLILASCPGESEDERWCWHVLLYAKAQLPDRPDREAILARLKAEFQNERDQHGSIRLPDSYRPAAGPVPRR